VSIVNVALPSIRSALHEPIDSLQWVLSGYALTFGLVLVPAGRLGDARGRRTVCVAGLALFTLTSAAQTGQRIGSAAGIAAVGVVFFSTLAGTRSYARAFQDGLLIILAFVVAALTASLHDVISERRQRPRVRSGLDARPRP
jgi:MFS family permease